ncbi:MAG: hypothetical protein QXL94_05565, partial [Candidatus Parvarchaeum sp.]
MKLFESFKVDKKNEGVPKQALSRISIHNVENSDGYTKKIRYGISMSTLINYDLMTIHGGIDWNKSEIINVTGQQLTKGLSTNKV